MNTTVGMLASRPVITIDIDAPLIEAYQLMSARRISCIVVLFKDEPIGILTERDVVFAANWVISDPRLRMREVMDVGAGDGEWLAQWPPTWRKCATEAHPLLIARLAQQGAEVKAPPGFIIHRSGCAGRSHFALLIKE